MLASACAKVILFGEHAVVYDQPAIAVPFPALRVEVTTQPAQQFEIYAKNLDQVISMTAFDNALIRLSHLIADDFKQQLPPIRLNIQSYIPIASGLGSGAAISAAVGRALSQQYQRPINNEKLNSFVYEIEKQYHGTPSGIDNTVIVYEKPIRFVKSQPIDIIQHFPAFYLVIGDTGVRAPTYDSVGDVRKLYESNPEEFAVLFAKIGRIADDGLSALQKGNWELMGNLMNQNHRLLQEMTVSSPQLNQLVEVACQAGAYGAKLSGGGRGGNMIALVTTDMAEEVARALKSAGAVHTYMTEIKP